MKKILTLVVWLSVLALVWAAGHDILKGEPDAWQEWTVVLAGLCLAMYVLARQIKHLKPGSRT